ncbi:MAG TPA: hypothetical protein VFB41_07055 [Solirubrobacteraceae bacterium]|nr:hypothetical protein [Solirubrobacteraceae bacterium]
MSSAGRLGVRSLVLLLGIVAAVVLVVLVGAQADAGAKPDNGPNAGRGAIVAYWTPARMADAVPRGKAQGNGKPVGGGSSGSYTRSAVSSPTSYPNRTNGKVFMTMGSTNYQCSGTAVQSANESLVWTAGHCVYDAATGGYAHNFMFVPAYDNGAAPFGRFTATTANLRTTGEYAATESFAYDAGAARVGTNANGQSLAQAAGEREISFTPVRDQAYTLFGYPVDRKTGNGKVMYQCSTRWALDDSSLSPPPIGVQCNWPAGSSGGAWIGANGALSAVTSYGYRSLADYIFASFQGASALALYNDVQG